VLRSIFHGTARRELDQHPGLDPSGGLALSQLLTLYTTPVVYLYLARLQSRLMSARSGKEQGPALVSAASVTAAE
jgi:hypothetical protein